jgi:hypothetical protein
MTNRSATRAFGSSLLAVLLLLSAPARQGTLQGQEPAPDKPAPFNGAEECKRCHTRPDAEYTRGYAFVLLTEYSVWKTLDKHAQAFAVLKNKRSQQMGELLGDPGHPVDVTKPSVGCINCHGLGTIKSTIETFTPEDGVSCAGCHGPSEKWIFAHSRPGWRKKTPEEKQKEGMVDLRNPVRRAELCMSCHVGNAAEGKVVTHDMFAAGHPPLPPFEIATFSKNMPQHWRNPKDVPYLNILRELTKLEPAAKRKHEKDVGAILNRYRPENRAAQLGEVTEYINLYPTQQDAEKTLQHYPFANPETQETRLALIGNLVGFRETMRLVADRSASDTHGSPEKIWPELVRAFPQEPPLPEKYSDRLAQRWTDVALAHSDCYACHHDLQYPGYRQKRGFGYRLPDGDFARLVAGRTPVRSWSMTLLGPALTHLEKTPAPQIARARTAILGLIAASSGRPFGDPEKLVAAARPLVSAWDEELKTAPFAALEGKDLRPLVQELCALGSGSYLDYESARELGSVLEVAIRDMRLSGSQAEQVGERLSTLDKTLSLNPYTGATERRDIIRGLIEKDTPLEKSDAEVFWKTVKNPADPNISLNLEENKYLNAVKKADNAELNRAMQEGVVDKLEDAGTRELDAGLKKLANYDIDAFRKTLREIGELLAAK